MKKIRINTGLKQNIIYLLVLGWVAPVIIMTTLLATYVDQKSEEQMKQTVASSVDKATDVFNLELSACETASKNASYYSDIRDAYLNYCDNLNARDFNSEVNGFLRSEYKYNEIVKSALLVFPKDNEIFYTYNNSASASYKNIEYFLNNANEDILEKAKDLRTQTTIFTKHGNNYMIRNLMLSNFVPYAVLSLELNDNSFLKDFKAVWGYEDVVLLQDASFMMGNKRIISDNRVEYMEEELRKNNQNFFHFADCSYVIKKWTQYDVTFEAIIKLDNQVIYQKIYATWLIFGILIIAMIPLTYIIFRFFRKNVTEPMDAMMRAYDEVANKNYGYQMEEKIDAKEFYYMQKSFNQMSMQIKEQFDKIYKEEIALRDAKIMALQSQINPHFLNNTFEIINWEARLNGNIKVSKMIEALSTMLEATMNRRGDHLHALSEEITYVDAYAYIISERLGDKFNYVKEIDESLLDVKVPKLIVQPIVENAVEHGLSEVQKGNICMKIYKKEEYIYIEIINDGGLSEENKSKIKRLLEETIDPEKERSLSLGIRNVNNRLKLIYGEECGLSIENGDETHTISTICLKDSPVLEQ